MRKIFMLMALALMLMMAACGLVPATPEIVLDLSDEIAIELSPKGEKRHVGFTSALTWSVEVVDGAQWLAVSPAEVIQGTHFLLLRLMPILSRA